RPDLRAVEGGRWYYRLDRVTKRRCWYQESARWESRNTRPWWRTTPWGTTTERDPNAATSWVASVAALISGKDANEQDNAVQNSRRTEALPERTFKPRARTAWGGGSHAPIAGRPAHVTRTESEATAPDTALDAARP